MHEFKKLRNMLDAQGIIWKDKTNCEGLTMNRTIVKITENVSFSAIFGYGSYGYYNDLLETAIIGINGVEDIKENQTAEQAFNDILEMIEGA